MTDEQEQSEITDEEAILKIAQAMKDNAPTPDEKQNVHTFLTNIIEANAPEKIVKVGNLRDDKEMNELGHPTWNVRGALEMARISNKIMANDFFRDYFEASAVETTATSLSRTGFIIRQGTTQTKNVVDATKRRKRNKGMFGSEKVEESGGDAFSNQPNTN